VLRSLFFFFYEARYDSGQGGDLFGFRGVGKTRCLPSFFLAVRLLRSQMRPSFFFVRRQPGFTQLGGSFYLPHSYVKSARDPIEDFLWRLSRPDERASVGKATRSPLRSQLVDNSLRGSAALLSRECTMDLPSFSSPQGRGCHLSSPSRGIILFFPPTSPQLYFGYRNYGPTPTICIQGSSSLPFRSLPDLRLFHEK